TLRAAANEKSAPLFIGGTNWRVAPCDNGFHFEDSTRTLDLPLPALPGTHQIENACLAIAALSALPEPIPPQAIARGLQTVEWPARLQKITTGALFELLPPGWQLWLDGGHNDSAGAALAAEAARWRAVDHCPLHLVFGMLATKNPPEFLAPLAPFVASLRAVAIPGETPAFVPADLAQAARDAGIADAAASTGVPQALTELATGAPGRILICGSLYLAGHVLRLNGNKAL
ncbi:MAG TPA: bifunctional folylpolyglutamate synthase/dihydrofolate synthase, partial [Alphaproteobacteria bacterium]|nr:bifunctional folylpolyglutamate synthase/dihydrofolate synthase [Alphaproteobacteria bacterium]